MVPGEWDMYNTSSIMCLVITAFQQSKVFQYLSFTVNKDLGESKKVRRWIADGSKPFEWILLVESWGVD